MSHGDHIVDRRGYVRGLLVALGLPQALIGLWALLAPHSFYDDFPVGHDGWVSALGPFDEHLVTDVGSLFVALGVLLMLAAASLRRSAVIGAAVAWLIYSVPHLVWHVFNLEPLSTVDAVVNTVALAGQVVGGLLVLGLLRTPRPARLGELAGGAPRMTGPDRPGLLARLSYRESRRQTGTVPDPIKVFAHHPTLLAGYGSLELATRRADRLPERLKALAGLKAAALAGCEFCTDIGSHLAREAGIGEDELRELPLYATSPRFSEIDRLVLDYAVGMSRTPVEVPDELFARLREHFDEAQMVELTNEIAIENYRARFNWAFGIGAQGFSEGQFCVRPETVAEQSAAPVA